MSPAMKIHGQEKRPARTIPRIVHQLWINRESDPEIPKEWVELSKTWQNLNPGWDYCLWRTRWAGPPVADSVAARLGSGRPLISERYRLIAKSVDITASGW